MFALIAVVIFIISSWRHSLSQLRGNFRADIFDKMCGGTFRAICVLTFRPFQGNVRKQLNSILMKRPNDEIVTLLKQNSEAWRRLECCLLLILLGYLAKLETRDSRIHIKSSLECQISPKWACLPSHIYRFCFFTYEMSLKTHTHLP